MYKPRIDRMDTLETRDRGGEIGRPRARWPGRAVGAATLATIIAAGLGLRLWGLEFGLPAIVHVDENSYVTKRLVGFITTGDLHPHFFLNPTGFPYLLYLETKLLYLAGRLFGFYSSYQADMLAIWNAGGALLFLLARLTSALLGAATIWVVQRIGALLFRDAAIGVVGAALLAVNFLHVRDSHFGTNDVTMVFFLALAFLACVHVYREGRLRHYLACGVLSGIAAGMKYNAAVILLPLTVAHGLRLLGGRQGLRSWAAQAALLAGAACAVLGFLATTPYALLDYDAFQIEFLAQRLKMDEGAHFGQDLMPTWRFYLWGARLSLGWTALLALVPCSLLAWRRHGGAFVLLAVFPLTYLAYLSSGRYYFLRFLLPALPFVVLALAAGLVALIDLIPRVRLRMPTLVAATAMLGWQPALASLQLDLLLGRQDTRLEARHWIDENIPEGSVVYVEGYGPQTRLDSGNSIGNRRYTVVSMRVDAPFSDYRSQGVEYFVVSSWVAERFDKVGEGYAGQRDFYRQLAQEAEVVHVIDPFEEETHEFHLDEVYAPIEPCGHRRPGPRIEIRRLRRS